MKSLPIIAAPVAALLAFVLLLAPMSNVSAQSVLPTVTVNGVPLPAQDWWYWYYQAF